MSEKGTPRPEVIVDPEIRCESYLVQKSLSGEMDLVVGDEIFSEGYTKCGFIALSDEFAKECKPYNGDPRGGIGSAGYRGNCLGDKIKYVLSSLLSSRKRRLKNTDDTFVCIPKHDYLTVINLLLEIEL